MRLDDPASLKAFLKKYGLSADKALGQHFLISSRVVNAICSRVADREGILEIGPGPGILTGPLSLQSGDVIAVELDERFADMLAETAPSAKIVMDDALRCDLAMLLENLPKKRAIVSNLPYYITHPLLTRIADVRNHFDRAVLMMQKEVADKILAQAGKRERGSLSVFLQACFTINEVVRAPAGAFMPPPKVESLVLEFSPRTFPIAKELEVPFFRFVRTGFTQPRKTLANNLSPYGREAVIDSLEKSRLSRSVRPHELTEADWISVFEAMPSTRTNDS